MSRSHSFWELHRLLKRLRGDVLKAGDRIEEIPGVHDAVACDVRTLPVDTEVHFFRPSPLNRLNHWCPLLYDLNYGVEYTLDGSCLIGDILHSVDGGVAQYAGGITFQLLLDNATAAFRIREGPKVVVTSINRFLQMYLQQMCLQCCLFRDK